jgi:hypothetical protein
MWDGSKLLSLKNLKNNLENLNHLRVSGFHLWGCVNKMAEYSYSKGLDVLVDEDLTELFSDLIINNLIDLTKYQGFNLETWIKSERVRGTYFINRKNKPWMIQNFKK